MTEAPAIGLHATGTPAAEIDWLLVPGERIVWQGRPVGFLGPGLRTLARELGIALLVTVVGIFGIGLLAALWWPLENWLVSGDLTSLRSRHELIALFALGLLAISAAVLVFRMVAEHRRLSLTRYAITDRRVMEMCRGWSGTRIGCRSLASLPAALGPQRDGTLVIGLAPVAKDHAPGTIVARGGITLHSLGPTEAAALKALNSRKSFEPGASEGPEATAKVNLWSGAAIQSPIWDISTAVKAMVVLFGLCFVLFGVLLVTSVLFPTVTAPLLGEVMFEDVGTADYLFSLVFGIFWLGFSCFWVGAVAWGFLAEFLTRRSLRFRVTARHAEVSGAPDPSENALFRITLDLRLDLWLGRRPSLLFAQKVVESEGGNSLEGVGFEAPADPVGAYKALVEARHRAALRQLNPPPAT